MSAFPPKADIDGRYLDVRSVPLAVVDHLYSITSSAPVAPPSSSANLEKVERRFHVFSGSENNAATIRRPGWVNIVVAVRLADRSQHRPVSVHDVNPELRFMEPCRNRNPLAVRAPKRLNVVPVIGDGAHVRPIGAEEPHIEQTRRTVRGNRKPAAVR